jgi:succinoglycan biosynthesis protein ExoA
MAEVMQIAPSSDVSPSDSTDQDLSISVIVPVRNEGRHIEATLRQLLAQDYEPQNFEILVIDGSSLDDTVEIVSQIAAKNPQVRLIHNPKKLSSAARNIGIRQSLGEAVLIIDGHCEIQNRRLLKDVSAAFRRSGAACLGRPQPLDISDATPMQQAIAAARASRLGHHPDSLIYAGGERIAPAQSVAAAYRREVFEIVGYFDERFDACEDVELNHRIDRAGLDCFFTPSIQVHYRPRASLGGLFRQIVRYGRGRVRLFEKHPDVFSFGSVVPAIFWLGVVFGWIGVVLWPAFCIPYVGAISLYVAVMLLESARIAVGQKQFRLLYLLPPIWTTIHLASALGVWMESLRWLLSRHLHGKRLNKLDAAFGSKETELHG